MEKLNEKYKSRCIKRLEEWNAPLSGWECDRVIDMAEGSDCTQLQTCELCDCSKVRYVHVMQHQNYFEDISVGCICAGIMEGDILAAKDRERKMKNRAKRKANYLKRNWNKTPNGTQTLRYKNHWLAIEPDRFNQTRYQVICDGKVIGSHEGRPIVNVLKAIHVAFSIVDPPITKG